MSHNVFTKSVLRVLVESGLPQANIGRRRQGWFVQENLDDPAACLVFWGDGTSRELPALPRRREGLLSIIDALAGRAGTTLQGCHHRDGGPVCVLVTPLRGDGAHLPSIAEQLDATSIRAAVLA